MSVAEAREFTPESARVARLLRDEILDGARPSGSKLVERDLALELGVSRVPVRDALKILIAEGLVTPRPRTWAIVRDFAPSDIADLHEVRAAMEALTFRLAAERHTRVGLAKLQACLDAERHAVRTDDAVAARHAAADFHEVVGDLAANDLLSEIDVGLRSRMRWLLGQYSDLQRIAEEHSALYAAIAGRNIELVDDLVAKHLETTRYLAGTRTSNEITEDD